MLIQNGLSKMLKVWPTIGQGHQCQSDELKVKGCLLLTISALSEVIEEYRKGVHAWHIIQHVHIQEKNFARRRYNTGS